MTATEFRVGQVVHAASASFERRRTRPPEHYTEDTLLADMLAAHKFASTEADRQMLRSISGIGTSRTRGAILANLVKRGFLAQKRIGKRHQIRITPNGKQLLQFLPPMVTDVALTAKWEKALEMVAKGELRREQLCAKVEAILRQQIPEVLGCVVKNEGGTNVKS